METRSTLNFPARPASPARVTEHIPNSATRPRVLVQTDYALLASVKTALEDQNFDAICLNQPSEIVDHATMNEGKNEYRCIVANFDGGTANGLELLADLRSRYCTTPIIFLMGEPSLHLVMRAMKQGALAVVEKRRCRLDLPSLVREAVHRDVKKCFRDQVESEVERGFASLSRRERTILKMLVDGLQNRDVARRLEIGLRTVERDRRGILEKMNAKTLPDLVRKAVIIFGEDYLYGYKGEAQLAAESQASATF